MLDFSIHISYSTETAVFRAESYYTHRVIGIIIKKLRASLDLFRPFPGFSRFFRVFQVFSSLFPVFSSSFPFFPGFSRFFQCSFSNLCFLIFWCIFHRNGWTLHSCAHNVAKRRNMANTK